MIYEWFVLALIVVCTLVPSLVVAATTRNSISTWYSGLRKPAWNPPNWLFGPIWTVLYLSMSVAVWLVWKAEPSAIWAFRLYAVQLLLNHLWSPTFFLLKRPAWAFALLAVLWVTIAATTGLFFVYSTSAGKLMIPYLAWVSFAGCLNYRIWKDNPSV